MMDNVQICGIPSDLPVDKAAIFRSRLLLAYSDIRPLLSDPLPIISIGDIRHKQQTEPPPSEENRTRSDSPDIRYLPQEPLYTFEQLILPEETLTAIRNAIELLKVEKIVFDDWGLRTIEPNPKVALNFYGPPGTGKTLAAHAIANYLHKTILIASYAEIESKYHGDGPVIGSIDDFYLIYRDTGMIPYPLPIWFAKLKLRPDQIAYLEERRTKVDE